MNKLTLLIGGICLLISTISFGAPPVKGQKVNAIAYDAAVHAANAKSRAGMEVKEETTTGKGRSCCIYITNVKGYYIDVYIDGYYYGTVAPWSSANFCVSDWSTIYCETTNGLYYWKKSGNCNNSQNYFDLLGIGDY